MVKQKLSDIYNLLLICWDGGGGGGGRCDKCNYYHCQTLKTMGADRYRAQDLWLSSLSCQTYYQLVCSTRLGLAHRPD